jgi:quercetin dioxygenase-like cupin family protein
MHTICWFAPFIGATLAALTPQATASATPGYGVDGVILSQATFRGHDYVTRQITIEPGGSTGWHFHDGRVYGLIKEGTLTHNTSDCSVDGIFNPGDTITEAAGSGDVHIGRNLGQTAVVMQVVYIDPVGSPLSDDAPDPGCGFA